VAVYLALALARMSALVRSGSGPSEEDRHRAGVKLGHDRGLLRADLVHDRDQVLPIGLPGRQGALRQGVGGARTPPIEEDQPGERCQRAQEQGVPGSSQAMSTWPKLLRVRTRSGGPWPSTW
jgi:hypothetical protein